MPHSSAISEYSYPFYCVYATAAQSGGGETALLCATAVHAYK